MNKNIPQDWISHSWPLFSTDGWKVDNYKWGRQKAWCCKNHCCESWAWSTFLYDNFYILLCPRGYSFHSSYQQHIGSVVFQIYSFLVQKKMMSSWMFLSLTLETALTGSKILDFHFRHTERMRDWRIFLIDRQVLLTKLFLWRGTNQQAHYHKQSFPFCYLSVICQLVKNLIIFQKFIWFYVVGLFKTFVFKQTDNISFYNHSYWTRFLGHVPKFKKYPIPKPIKIFFTSTGKGPIALSLQSLWNLQGWLLWEAGINFLCVWWSKLQLAPGCTTAGQGQGQQSQQ